MSMMRESVGECMRVYAWGYHMHMAAPSQGKFTCRHEQDNKTHSKDDTAG